MAHLGRDIDQKLRKLFADELTKLLKALAAKLDLDAEEIRKAVKKFEETDAAHILGVPAKPSPNGKGPHASGDTAAAKAHGVGVDRGDGRDVLGQWTKGHGPGSHLNEHGDTVHRRWTPHHKAGPLGKKFPANTFRSASYDEVVLGADTRMYRVIGPGGNPHGGFWTREKPKGPLQAQLDMALLPEWKRRKQGSGLVTEEQATHYVEAIVPRGTVIFEGPAGHQIGDIFPESSLVGGGPQVFIQSRGGHDKEGIPDHWLVGDPKPFAP